MKQMFIIILITTAFMLSAIVWSSGVIADSYTFGTENIITGYSINPSYRNSEDGNYNELIEGDVYPDTNLTVYDQYIYNGTTSGSFPSSLVSDDSVRYGLIEEENQYENYIAYLLPESTSNGVYTTGTPATALGDLWSNIDDGLSNDGDTSYIYCTQDNGWYAWNLGNIDTPPGNPSYEVTFIGWIKDSGPGTSSATLQLIPAGGCLVSPINAGHSVYEPFSDSSSVDGTGNPLDLADINAMSGLFGCSDTSPTPQLTNFIVYVYINYTTNYDYEDEILWNTATNNSQTIGYGVYVQGYSSDSEDFTIWAYNFSTLYYDFKITVDAETDTDYYFTINEYEQDNDNGYVLLRIKGATLEDDTTQTTFYLDILNVCRIELGYGLDIDMTSSVPATGDITLGIKGYVSTEEFDISIWNYTSSSWVADEFSISSLSNYWQSEYDLDEINHRSGTNIKIRFEDSYPASSDQIIDILYLDILCVNCTTTNTPPEFTSTPPITSIHNNTAYSYDASATDIDEDELTFDLEGNITNWASIIPSTGLVFGTPTIVGQYWMNISVSDEINPLVWQNTSITVFSDAPIIHTTPITTWENNTLYTYDAYATDIENENLIYGLSGNITDWATIDSVTGIVSGTPTIIGSYWLNLSVTDGINIVYDNDLITISEPSSYVEITHSQLILFVIIIMILGCIIAYALLV